MQSNYFCQFKIFAYTGYIYLITVGVSKGGQNGDKIDQTKTRNVIRVESE